MSYASMAGGAFNVGGSILQWVGGRKAQREMGRAFSAEQALQQQYRQQGAQEFRTGLEGATAEQANLDLAKGTAERQAGYEDITKTPQSFTPTSTTGAARDQSYNMLLGLPQARLGAYSDWALEQLIRDIRTQDALNKTANFAAGDAQVFPYRMYKAQHAGDTWQLAGQALASMSGTAEGFSSLYGGPPGGGNAGQMQAQAWGTPSYYPSFSGAMDQQGTGIMPSGWGGPSDIAQIDTTPIG